VISAAPSTVRYGQTFSVESPQGSAIAKVALVRLGAATHSADQGQRYVPLAFTPSTVGVTPKVPAAAAVAPPGYYMLFLVDAQGVPSVAKTVRVTR